MSEFTYKTIKLRSDKWLELKELADKEAARRGSHVSLPDIITEAVKRYQKILDDRYGRE